MSPQVQLDWLAYWREFQAAHRGDPVRNGGRWWFRDGWSYSDRDPAGPEWPPPEDPREAAAVVRLYWDLRRKLVSAELRELELDVENLRQLQSVREVVLQERVSYLGEEGKLVSDVRPVDLRDREARIGWLREDLAACDAELGRVDRERAA